MKNFLVCLLLFCIYFTVAIFTLSDYGINWDEPTHFMRGQTFANYIFSGKKDFSYLPKFDDTSYIPDFGYVRQDEATGLPVRRSVYQNYPLDFFTTRPEWNGAHPPLAGILAAISNIIFYQKLGIVSDVYSYNLVPLFLSALLVGYLYYWVKRTFGVFAGIVASISLALFPLWIGESHYNIKDIPQAVFFSCTILFFYLAVSTLRVGYVVLFILSASFAFATKLNIAFSVFILFPWLIYYLRTHFTKPLRPAHVWLFFQKHRLFSTIFLLTPLIMLGIFILCWPAIWFNPSFLLSSFSFYKTIGTSGNSAVNAFKAYPLYYVIFATPLVILLYSLVGVIRGAGLSGKKRDVYVLVLLWFLVPIIRVMLPKTAIYGGVRQIIEFVPAMAILSGIGAQIVAPWLRGFMGNKRVKNPFNNNAIPPSFRMKLVQILILLSFVPLAFKLISLHPNEGVFFNSLIGGLKGAQARHIPDAGVTLGNPYRQASRWLNQYALKDALIAFGHGNLTNIPRVWLRKDLKLHNTYKSGPAREGEYVVSVTDQSPYDDRFDLRYYKKFLVPVYQVEVDGVSLLTIWKNDADKLKEGYEVEEEVKGLAIDTTNSRYITITLPTIRNVTRIEFDTGASSNCTPPSGQAGRVTFNPGTTLPAITYVLQSKLHYPEPFYLFAAEPSSTLRFQPLDPESCLFHASHIRVFALKEQQ